MDFLSGLAKSAQSKPTSDEPTHADKPASDKPASNSDLLASAKTVAEAAQAQFSNEPNKSYDKAKAAGAAANLLDAAEGYAKLDETKGVGKYVEQAEGYLRKYGSGDHKAAAAAPAGEKTDAGDYVKKAEEELGKPSGGAGEAGAGDYLKQAEGLLNKPAGDGGEKKEESGGGYGDLMKAAGGFLNK